jgi:hypothetical protein
VIRSLLYRVARGVGDGQALASGNPAKVVGRARRRVAYRGTFKILRRIVKYIFQRLNCIRADVLRGKVKSTSTATVTQDGMYRDPDTGDIFKVQVAVHGSGNLYAKRLVELDEPKVMKTKTVSHEFVYEPGLLRRIKPEWRMTLEEAKAWGALYGTCCVCGATLTKEASIAAGIGPVCSGKGFWDTDPEVAWYQRNDGWV